MKWLITIHIAPNVASEQLQELAETLELWCDKELRQAVCIPQIDSLSLEDLQSGELPQPEQLRAARFKAKAEENPLLAFADMCEDETRLRDAVPDRADRAVYIYVRPDWTPDDREATGPEVVARIRKLRRKLRRELPAGLVTDFSYREVPDEYEDSEEDQCH